MGMCLCGLFGSPSGLILWHAYLGRNVMADGRGQVLFAVTISDCRVPFSVWGGVREGRRLGVSRRLCSIQTISRALV